MNSTELIASLSLAILAVQSLVCLAFFLNYRSRRKSLRRSTHSLRVLIAQAQSWVETKPSSKEAADNLKRASRILEVMDDGIKQGRHPYLMLQHIVSDPGFELAVAARFRAMADKKL